MTHLIFFCFVILVAGLLSKVEIEIEGKHGYAQRLPVSWRSNNKWMRRFFVGTSYHLYMGLFLVTLVHLPFAVGLAWTLNTEMLVLSWLAFMTVAEDFFWFLLNPHFRFPKFRRQHIPWFQDRWLGVVPLWYWWYLPAGIILYCGSQILCP